MLRTRILGKNKKTLVLILLLLTVTTLFVWWSAKKPPMARTTGTCSGYYSGIYDSIGPSDLEKMARDRSKAIVIATPEDPVVFGASVHVDDPAPLVRVTRVLKGHDSIHKGDVITVCAGMGHIELQPTKRPAVLLFFEGRDGNVWVPVEGGYGIAPQNKDGSFSTQVRGQPVTVNELQRVIE